jgi:glycerophosphoryl diester phosphodiesterase
MKYYKLISILYFILLPVQGFSSKCIAHRGNNIDNTENTWDSFFSAYSLGADGIEIDIQHTSDGKAIIFHDKRLRRLVTSKPNRKCPRLKKIKKLTLSEVLENCQYDDGQEILTLKKFLKKSISWDIHLFIEFKDIPSINTLELIDNHFKNFNKIKFISFKKSALSKAHKYLAHRTKKDTNFLKLYYFWVPSKPKWTPNIPIRSYWLFYKRILKLNKFYSMGMWVIDDPEDIKRAKKNNVEFITTNNPKLCIEI